MCDSYSQFDDGVVGRTEKAQAVSKEDISVIHTLLLSTGVSGPGPILAIISKILDRSVAGWGQLSAFDAVRIKTFLREQGSVL